MGAVPGRLFNTLDVCQVTCIMWNYASLAQVLKSLNINFSLKWCVRDNIDGKGKRQVLKKKKKRKNRRTRWRHCIRELEVSASERCWTPCPAWWFALSQALSLICDLIFWQIKCEVMLPLFCPNCFHQYALQLFEGIDQTGGQSIKIIFLALHFLANSYLSLLTGLITHVKWLL